MLDSVGSAKMRHAHAPTKTKEYTLLFEFYHIIISNYSHQNVPTIERFPVKSKGKKAKNPFIVAIY